jgi:hypothetical protein
VRRTITGLGSRGAHARWTTELGTNGAHTPQFSFVHVPSVRGSLGKPVVKFGEGSPSFTFYIQFNHHLRRFAGGDPPLSKSTPAIRPESICRQEVSLVGHLVMKIAQCTGQAALSPTIGVGYRGAWGSLGATLRCVGPVAARFIPDFSCLNHAFPAIEPVNSGCRSNRRGCVMPK